MKHTRRLSKFTIGSISRYRSVLAVMAVFGAVGAVQLLTSHAATPAASIEAESGTVSSAAAVVTDATASGGQAVKYGAGGGSGVTSACPPAPAYPNASCTGWQHTGVTLVKVPAQATSGTGWSWNGTDVVVSANNTTVSGLDISGGFDMGGKSGVTLKNSLVRGSNNDDYVVQMDGSGGTVMDTEIGGGSTGTAYTTADGMYVGGGTLLRLNIHHTDDGMNIDPYSAVSIQDSWIHDLPVGGDLNEPHSDGTQTQVGSGGGNPAAVTIQHNTIQAGNNDGVFIQSSAAYTVTGNSFSVLNRNGEISSYGVGGGGSAVKGPIRITNNVFTTGWEVSAIENDAWPSGTVISGNTYSDGSAAP